jgi:hypothetical protein
MLNVLDGHLQHVEAIPERCGFAANAGYKAGSWTRQAGIGNPST